MGKYTFRKGHKMPKEVRYSPNLREITQTARDGGGELDTNPRLQMVVDKALRANMTKDSIQRAIDKACGNARSVTVVSLWGLCAWGDRGHG